MITLLVEPHQMAAVEAVVSGDSYRHLFRARRVAAGEKLRVVDGLGHARWAAVTSVDRRSARLALGEDAPANEPECSIVVVVATPKPDRAAWLVEKATELGARAICFLSTERAAREIGAAGLERLRRVAAAAVEQCHRSRLPAISGPHAWQELDALLAESTRRWFLDPAGELEAVGNPGPAAALLVGPEGGWTNGEREDLLRLGCLALGLGPRVLRVETAVVAGLALLFHRR